VPSRADPAFRYADRENIVIPENSVWIFHGDGGRFAGGVFSTKKAAEAWIGSRSLSGVLTAYPLDQGCFDWAMSNDLVTGKARDRGGDAEFVGSFTSAAQEHFHYENGAEA
jgi:hypothetical protein